MTDRGKWWMIPVCPPWSAPVEQQAVAGLLSSATTGPAGVLLVGDPGIGKTTLLLGAMESAAQRGFQVLSARMGPAEATLAFAAVAELLDDVDPYVIDELSAPQRLAVDRILARTASGPPGDEHAAGAALLTVLRRLSENAPVLVAVDDAQWVDSSSRSVLSFAVRRLAGPVGVLSTIRVDAVRPEVIGWLQMGRPEAMVQVQVSPLPTSGLRSMLLARLDRNLPRATVARIAEISGGNPFYALELARVADEHPLGEVVLPDTLSALVDDRLRLVDDVGDVLLTAAATSSPTVDQVAATCKIDVAQVVSILEDAESRDVVVLDGNRIRFTHPLLGTGVYARATAVRRQAVHRALAVTVDQPELRARHLALAATRGDAATLAALDAGADAAQDRGAPSAAAELVELAIGLGGDSHERLLRHAELSFKAGAVDQARERLEPLVDALAPGPLRSQALSLLGAVRVYGNSFPDAIEVLQRAEVDARGHPALHLLTLLRLAPTSGVAGHRAESIDYARRAMAEAKELGADDLRSQALAMWVNVSLLYGLGFDEDALDEALALEDSRGDVHLTYRASALEAVCASWRGRPDHARERLSALARHCEERGAEAASIWVAEHAVMAEVWLGRYRDAAAIAAAAVERANQIGGRHLTVVAGALLAVTDAYTGEVERCRRAALAAIADALASGGLHLAVAPRTTLGFLSVSQCEYSAALETLAPLLRAFDPEHGTEILLGAFLPDAVEALVAMGRALDAEPLVSALEANGARLDRPWMRAVGARGRALVVAAHGDLAGAERAALRAVEEHGLLPMPFEHARTLLVLGHVQRRARRRRVAATTLGEALEAFESLGTPLWAQRARSELQKMAVPKR